MHLVRHKVQTLLAIFVHVIKGMKDLMSLAIPGTTNLKLGRTK
jgi:hypothetical protein